MHSQGVGFQHVTGLTCLQHSVACLMSFVCRERSHKENTWLPQSKLTTINICLRISWMAFHVNEENMESIQ